MMRIMFEKGVTLKKRYRDLLSISSTKRNASYIVRQGEKQVQILDGTECASLY
jgi:hypothetical protein